MNEPESKVPVPEWYPKAIPALRKMWNKFIDGMMAADQKQSEYYNSVMKFEKIKKTVPERQWYENVYIPFGTYLYLFFGFVIEFIDGAPHVTESSLKKIKGVLADDADRIQGEKELPK